LTHFWLRTAPAHGATRFFSDAELADVRQFYQSTPDAIATPLRHFRGLAAELGIRDLLIKDESARFGLPAFKIAGARYAVARRIERGGHVRDLACATAGNHGRAVAHAGRLHGLRVHVHVPAGTAAARVNALRAEGADVVITSVGYEETVRLMAREAADNGWTIVSDTAWPGYEEIPRSIMAGYTWLMDEAAAQWHDTLPDVVIVQAGVGSLAGAVAGWLQHFPGPSFVIVEPVGSACIQASLHAGRRVTLDTCSPTAMVGLRCAEVSTLAWPVLESVVDAAIAVPDSLADEAIARLMRPAAGDDAAINTAASGAAGLAGLLALAHDPELAPVRTALRIGPTTRVLLIVTEGQTA
jgi:diaminopropionate ammonia-lyase